jgi:hypothetical protein
VVETSIRTIEAKLIECTNVYMNRFDKEWEYDLVVEINGNLSKISVKTTRTKNSESSYYVLLKNCGGASGKSKVRLFYNKSCDYIFVLTAEDKLYLIPSAIIKAKHGIAVGHKYAEYEVHCKKFSEFNNNDTD